MIDNKEGPRPVHPFDELPHAKHALELAKRGYYEKAVVQIYEAIRSGKLNTVLHVGHELVDAPICQLLKDKGYHVSPYRNEIGTVTVSWGEQGND